MRGKIWKYGNINLESGVLAANVINLVSQQSNLKFIDIYISLNIKIWSISLDHIAHFDIFIELLMSNICFDLNLH